MALQTKYFGALPDGSGTPLEFPEGIPAFEHETRFVLLAPEGTAPLVFLQSASTPGLCFLAVPVQHVDPRYQLAFSAEDLETAGFSVDQPPSPCDATILGILTCAADGITANLLAPIVINKDLRRAVQAIRPDALYSAWHPVRLDEREAGAC